MDLLQSITNATVAIDKDQLGSFLGLVEYYSEFVQNFASIAHPMTVVTVFSARMISN